MKPGGFLKAVGKMVKPVLEKAKKMKKTRGTTEELMSRAAATSTEQAKTSKSKSLSELTF